MSANGVLMAGDADRAKFLHETGEAMTFTRGYIALCWAFLCCLCRREIFLKV